MNQNIFILGLLFTMIIITTGYKYIPPAQWIGIRKSLSDKQISPEKKVEIKKEIFHKYKYRTYLKAKEFKVLNLHTTKYIPTKKLGLAALVGLANAIDQFDPACPVGFVRYSDAHIDKYLLACVQLHFANQTGNLIKNKWYDSYWDCIDNQLGPTAQMILRLKFSPDFKPIKTNYQIAKITKLSESEINNIIIESTRFVSRKISNNFNLGLNLFSCRTQL